MSSSMVGTVYSKVIEEVCNDCRTTFEEEGVDKKLLDEVKLIWQKKISERQVALMPWDPAPAANPPGASAATAPANRAPQAVPSSAPAPASGPSPMQRAPSQPQNASNGVQIKAEPNTHYDLQNLPNQNLPNNISAADRAQENIKNYVASRSQGGPIPQAPGQGQPPRMPAPQASQGMAAEEVRRRRELMMQQNNQRMQSQMAQQQSLGNAQTDGAGDWASFVADRRAAAADGAGEADVLFKQRIESMAQDLEGGGLMAPLSEVRKRNKSRKRVGSSTTGHEAGPGHFDGADSDDDKVGIKDEDEDAINSDLDDPDDDDIEEAEDDNERELMLCTYDKVQRVKNKWKCTLKDGVLATGGKEYVFHKAQGEFEW